MSNARKPQLIVHIGDPKTGTSSIQKALQDGAVRCETRRVLPWKRLNAIGEATCLKPSGRQGRAYRYGEVRDWLSSADADVAVLSSEYFSTIDPTVLQQTLAEHVPDHALTTKVIAYVRPHASRYLSAYIQRTKTGAYLGNIEDFFDTIRKNDPLQYTRRFGAWRETFGNRFVLRPFERAELRDGDIVTDFLAEALEGEPFALTATLEENVAVTLRSLAGLRLMHRRLKRAGVGQHGRALLGGAMANFFLPEKPSTGQKPQLDQTSCERLIKAYSDDARMLDEAFSFGSLMQDKLARCGDKVADEPIDLRPPRHFSESDRKAVVRRSDDLAGFILDDPGLWMMHYQTRKGQVLPDAEQKASLEANRVSLARIDDRMSELADLLRG